MNHAVALGIRNLSFSEEHIRLQGGLFLVFYSVSVLINDVRKAVEQSYLSLSASVSLSAATVNPKTCC